MKKSMAPRLGTLIAALIAVCSAAPTFAGDSVWYNDSLPLGATPAVSGGDAWNWITKSPTPFSGFKAHQSTLVSGLHEHWFSGAGATMTVNAGDTLYTYVLLDPYNIPSEIMVHWNNGSWEHRAYWGNNQITYGANNSAGRHYMGAMPIAGQWVRLEIPASAVGLEGATVSGMAFSQYGGRATWDVTGKFAPVTAGGTIVSTTPTSSPTTTTTPTTPTTPSSSSGTTTTTGSAAPITSGTTPVASGTTTSTPAPTSTPVSTTTAPVSTPSTTGTTTASTGTSTTSTTPTTTTASTGTTTSTPAPTSTTTSTTTAPASTAGTTASTGTSTTSTTTTASTGTTTSTPAPTSTTASTTTAATSTPTTSSTAPTTSTASTGTTATTPTATSTTASTTTSTPTTTSSTSAAPASTTSTASASVVSVAATSSNASLDGTQVAVLTFTRTGSTTANLPVNFNLGGTAAKWTDYYRLPQGDMPTTVTIPAGSASTTLSITGRANSTNANPETAIFTVVDGTGYTAASAAGATITIGAVIPVTPTLSIAATNATASIDGNQTGLITFARSGSTAAALVVNFTLAGTAAKWTDYYRLPQGDMPTTVTIPAGAASTTLPITARSNVTGSNPETVIFTLAAPTDSSLVLGTPASVTLNIVSTAAASAPATTTTTASTGPTGSTTTGSTPPSTGTGSTSTASTGTGSTGTTGTTTPPTTTTGTASTGTTTPPPATVGTTTTSPVTVAGADTIATRTADSIVSGNYVDDTDLQLPKVGSNLLRVLSPTLLELVSITTKQPDPAPATSWNFANALPAASEFTVNVGGQNVSVTAVGFKRRVLYAPLNSYDLRIQNSLYLKINASVSDNQLVTVTNPDSTLWKSTTQFQALSTPQRYSPAIHVNQEGYVPGFAKQAQVGYYLGDMGEMPIPSGGGFTVVDAATGTVVYTGTLSLRQDVGYQTNPLPYQQVYIADFSAFKTPGQYQIEVPGMGASLPFLIDDGIAMAWARTYSLGMYEQRSGMAVTMPFTRFTHAADHTAPALVPDTSSKFNFTWTTITGYATTTNSSNPAQTAPFLTSNAASLYPYNRTGSVDVSGGHFDAGDYSKYTINSAQLTHELIFAADNIPGIKAFDNLGIPESGDGIPDALQEAKWEADYLSKLQDTDGGFYFLTYPINSEYESGVLPENGQQQVVWPKNTSASAASVAALAEAGSSPAMIKYYPAAAASYLAKAKAGWTFLTKAIAAHGKAGSYQKLTFYGDNFGHDDELAWAAASMFAATGQSQYQTQLFSWFPNPADSATFRWGWWQMSEGWGNAIRDYAFAVRSGRLSAGALDASYLAACEGQIVAAGDNALGYTNASAYGTPFPPATKAVQGGGWYFSLDQASDMAIAYQVSAKQSYVDALVAAMNYEGGSNPVNTCYLEGLGMKRQQQTVSQYAQSSRRVLSPTGNVIGQVTAGFEYLNQYGSTLTNLSYPSDSGSGVVFPYYDRWSDAYNVTTEQITVNDARSFISAGFLASLTSSAATPWVAPQATITVPSATVALGASVTLSVAVAGQSLTGARIVWEGRDQMPAYGSTYTVSPVNNGDQWVECEVEWPDGRRAFAVSDFQANSTSQIWIDDALPANATPNSGGGDSWNWTSSGPTAKSGSLAFQMANKSGEHDVSFNGSTGSMDDDQSTIGQQGSMKVNPGDSLTAWVYLNPSSTPTEIMMCWYDGSSYEHRAYWGANQISWGSNNTPGCFNAGALPSTGGWVKISVPASAVNLEGATVSGMTFAAYGGQVTWDAIGRN